MKRKSNIELGEKGEKAAKIEYEKHGFRLFCNNMHFGRYGELDLVLIRDEVPFNYCGQTYKGTVVFCEVKTRLGTKYGTAAESVGRTKQLKIRTMAQYLMQDNPGLYNYILRFDVAEVYATIVHDGKYEFQVNIIQNAF